MDPNAPIKYSDLIQPDDSISNLQKQLEDLANTYKTVADGITSQAKSVKAALASVSGATAKGQESIKNAVNIIDKLVKKEAELKQSTSEAAKDLAKLNAGVRKNNQMMKLQMKYAENVPDSYNALSAEYGIIKIQLDEMSEAERKTSERGQELEKRAGQLMAKMKELQEVTGKHTLSVGDYGVATAHMASDIRNGIQALTQMRVEMMELEKSGQKGSERWLELSKNSQKLSTDLRDLKRQYQITKLETNALGQQTKYLNDLVGFLSTGAGSLSAATGAIQMFGGGAAGAAEALVQLNSVMAITNGLTQAWNNIYKQGNVLLLIRNQQEKLRTVTLKLQTKSTWAAVAAQKALNLVVAANPYALLAIAVAALVGGIILWVNSNAKLIRQQKLLNQQTAAQIDYAKKYNEELRRTQKESQKALEQDLEIAKARKAGYLETQELEKKIQDTKTRNNEISRSFYSKEINDLEANRKELARLREELLKVQSVNKGKRVEIQLDAEGPAMKVRASRIVDIIQDKINNLNEKVQIATELVYDQKQLEADAKELEERHKQEMLEIEALERRTLRSAEDVQIALLNDRFNRERDMAKASIDRQIIDLQVQLQTENNLTLAARKAINQQILDLQKQLVRDLEDIDNEELKANITTIRQEEDARMKALEESADKRRQILKMEYDREIEDIEFRLDTERDLTDKERASLNQQIVERWRQYYRELSDLENEIRGEQLDKESEQISNRLALVSEGTKEALALRLEAIENQRQAELVANRKLVTELRQDEASINRKYDRMALEESIKSQNEMLKSKLSVDQEYEESVFNLRMHSEMQVTRFQLQQQKERLKAEIQIQKKLLDIQTGGQRELTEKVIKTLENQIKAVDREIRKASKIGSIWELFGFDSDAIDALKTLTDQILDSLRAITQARLEAAEEALENAQRETDASLKFLELELEARNAGYANMVDTAQREVALNREKEAQLLKEKKKAQQQQAAIDTLTQVSSLVTAVANIWSAFSGLGAIGIILALAGIATMFASFSLSKAKASQIAKETYGEGTVELLHGGSHQSGNDVDLGTKPDGTKRRAEGGEFFAVINKRNSRKYRGIIPDVINSLNDGTFASKYMGLYDKMGQFAVDMSGSVVDLKTLENDVSAIREQGDERRYMDAQGNTVIIYKNLTRRIKS